MEKKNTKEEKCNCNDEFVTKPCPIHSIQPKTEESSKYGKDSVIVTDDFITPSVYGTWEGFIFECPSCHYPSIMVNKDMGNFCSNCGRSTIVRSKIVTEFIRNLSNKNGEKIK